MNQLKVHLPPSIQSLAAAGWSQRKIARELTLDRATVAKYLRAAAAAKPAISTPGSTGALEAGPAPPVAADLVLAAKPATPATLGSKPGRDSLCAAFAKVIDPWLLAGLSAQRIYQDLVGDHSFTGSYQSVKRFVRRRTQTLELPFRRLEVAAGAEMQVDFGQGAWVEADGKRRRPHLFRAVLSHSRKGYSEVVWRQTTETFIRCLENAFRAFGGIVPITIVDNLKAAVLLADWFDPELNPKLRSFAEHYGTAILPTRPATPRHKGKIEAGVKFAQANALKGRKFPSLADQNLFLLEWERTVADTRLHGTIRQQVGPFFLQAERPALRPLPASLFPSFEEAPRKVHRDGYVAFQHAFYSVPPEYLGHDVWVRAESRVLKIFTQRMEFIAAHARVDPGRFATIDAHLHSHKRHLIERGADDLLERCQLLGTNSGAWARGILQQRGPQGLRVLQGLLQLAREHPIDRLEQACGQAVHRGAWFLRAVRALVQCDEKVVQIDFLQAHPLIRDLRHYQLHPTHDTTPIPPP
jgi:transposase